MRGMPKLALAPCHCGDGAAFVACRYCPWIDSPKAEAEMKRQLPAVRIASMRLTATVARPLALCVALAPGCDRQANTYEPPPPPQVTIAQPLKHSVTDYATFTGNIAAVATVDVRARVKGFLQSMNFVPGTAVKKDQVLFIIEPAPYQAALEQAQANLARDQAKLQLAEVELKRTNELAQEQAATPLEVLQRTSDRDAAKAQVAADEAAVQEAALDLSYTQVTSPVDGAVSRNYVDVGNLVGDGQTTLLTIVVSQDPVYIYFTVSETEYLRCRSQLQEDQQSTSPDTKSGGKGGQLEAALATDEGFPHLGRVDFTDVKVEPATGTLQLRGIFPNPGGELLPGMFSRVRVPIDQADALLVPDEAVGIDQAGEFVLIVNAQGEVEHQPITPGPPWQGMRAVREGLKPEDWVIVKGLQRVRPGQKVDATKMTLTAPEAASPSSLTTGAKPQAGNDTNRGTSPPPSAGPN